MGNLRVMITLGDSCSIACSSSVSSFIKAAVTFALSWILPLKFVEGPAEVTTPNADDFTAFVFPLSGGLLPFPFPTDFLPCHPGVTFRP